MVVGVNTSCRDHLEDFQSSCPPLEISTPNNKGSGKISIQNVSREALSTSGNSPKLRNRAKLALVTECDGSCQLPQGNSGKRENARVCLLAARESSLVKK